MLLADFLSGGTTALERLYPAAEARSLVNILCESVLGTRNYTHIVEPLYVIPQEKEEMLSGALDRLCAGEPIQYVTGYADFCGFRFRVTPSVLIPRPETELLCREAVSTAARIRRMRSAFGDKAGPVRVLDLCTGSGCIAWTVALSVSGASVVGVDISEEALEVARGQEFAHELKASDGVAPLFVQADVLDPESDIDQGEFDLVLSNPPYIMESEKAFMRPNVLDYEPSLALFVPDGDPLVFYRAIAQRSMRLMAPDAFGMTEINESLGPETEAVFREAGFASASIVKDYFDKNRFVIYQK